MKETMFFNWNTLRNMLDEQIKDSSKYGDKFTKPYRQVRYLMDLIENGEIEGVYPDNCVWKRTGKEGSILSDFCE